MMVEHTEMSPVDGIIIIAISFVVLCVFVVLGWVVPIMLGVRAAKRKNYSPLWMLFGIHPLFGWVACIVAVNYRICPFCHASFANPPSSPFSPTPPS